MRSIAWLPAFALCVALCGCRAPGDPMPLPEIEWNPERYVCYRTDTPLTIDGKPDEAVWASAPWTGEFVDIRGGSAPAPRYSTRARMLWDDEYLYVAAELEDPHVWATLTERDATIYVDNDFELFIDPDGNTHDYFELEINALGTEWDLMLTRPYRDAGHQALTEWDFKGLGSAVHVDGTINDPTDEDRGWSVEIAVPWSAMASNANRDAPPAAGDQWRVNFSRVQWQVDVTGGGYTKRTDPQTGEPLAEDNWVWSPQGLVNMHYPEMWAFVQFSGRVAGTGEDPFVEHSIERARWALRQLYYAERNWHAEHGRYSYKPEQLALTDPGLADWSWPPEIAAGDKSFVAGMTSADGTRLDVWSDGRTRLFPQKVNPSGQGQVGSGRQPTPGK
jgi:hypothetical protein